MAKYLVTGGAGFIGSNIVEKLLSKKQHVIVLDNLSTGKEENIKPFLKNPLFEFMKADIRNKDEISEAIKDVDYVIHQAAIASVNLSFENPAESFDVNTIGTLNLLQAASKNKIKKFVFASSSSVYGMADGKTSEKIHKGPISPYALSKSFGEELCRLFSKEFKVPTVCLRYFNVFGPRQNIFSEYSAVIPKFISAFIKGESPIVFGTGKQTRDFVYVKDVAEANLKAAKSKFKDGEIFNVASGKSISLLQLINTLNKIFSERKKPIFKKKKSGDIMHSHADIEKIKKELRWLPKNNFEKCISTTSDWIKKEICTY
jgi:nucleoside-diphosphate-sugar epimerase